MFPKLWSLFLAVLACLPNKSVQETDPRIEGFIVNGETASPGQFPYAAALYFQGRFICTSSIISSGSVLTAAHCIVFDGVEQSAQDYYAIANVSRMAEEYRIEFSSVNVHPEYNDALLENDVAVFTTSEDIVFSDLVDRVCLAGPDTRTRNLEKVFAVGWGNSGRIVNVYDDALMYDEQVIIPNFICSVLTIGVDESKLCSNGFLSGVCDGDSGGPLVRLRENERALQLGITSYGLANVPCGTVSPAVFTRISYFANFIQEVATGEVCFE